MRIGVILLGLVIGCADKDEEEALPPTLSFLAPAEGATVAAGTVDITVVVENMTLEAPGETARVVPAIEWLLPGAPAWAHNEGEVEGYVVLRLDGADVAELGASQGQIDGVTAGAHTLEGELYYSDGDALDPAVTATVNFTAE